MNQTYQEFLEESTNTVKAKKNLGKIILFSTYFIVWIVTIVAIWLVKGHMPVGLDITLRWLVLPLLLLVSTIIVAKNNYWGNGNWFCVIGAAITFLTVPYTQFIEEAETATFYFTFRLPNPMYMVIGIIISVCGIGIGTLWNKKKSQI